MREHIAKLTESAYSKQEAQKYLDFEPDDAAMDVLTARGIEVMKNFPYLAGACAPMTATWVAIIRDHTTYPVHLVAGHLRVGSITVFGGESSAHNATAPFERCDLSWDGHCWLDFGGYIGDISVCRTAYSSSSPPELTQAITNAFGYGRGLIVGKPELFESAGISYVPTCVATDDQITGLVQGAAHIVRTTLS